MRLSTYEIAVIKSSVNNRDEKARVFLFGSRTDDKKNGGDIDLLVLTATLKFADKIAILAEIKKQLGDQKIDLILAGDEKLKTDPFISHAYETGIQL